ncbi:MAG: type II secretion system protein [Bdellovibrionota bacterium]
MDMRFARVKKGSVGFSLIESLIAMVGFLAVVAVAYQVINKQQRAQYNEITSARIDRQIDLAMDRFKKDVALIDPTWATLGVASIYPHQGLGFSSNYYVDPSVQAQGLNDGVTFLKKSNVATIYSINQKLYYPASNSAAGDKQIYGETFTVTNGDANLVDGTWVLIYQPGSYALGVISNVTGGGTNVTLRALNTAERQATTLNSGSFSTGHVTDAGVKPTSFDDLGTLTSSNADDKFVFDPTNARIQIVEPVSYEIDWQTSDGLPKSGANSYVLDAQGNPGKVLVRTTYHSGGADREYLAMIDEVWFTYDLLVSTSASGSVSLNGYLAGDIEFNVGRRNDGIQLLDLNLSDPATAQDQFQTSGNIVGLKINLVSNRYNSKGQLVALNRATKISLDPSLQGDDRFQEDDRFVAAVTDYGETDPFGSGVRDTIGRPGYLRTGSSHEVIVPVTRFDLNNPALNSGKLLIYDDAGCPVNSGTGCSVGVGSYITFAEPNGNKFFPNSVNVIELYGGARRIIVGGMSVEIDERTSPPTVVNRYGSVATIELGANETLAGKMDGGTSTTTCNIDNCNVSVLADAVTPDFKDTGGGISTYIDSGTSLDVTYTASMTKASANSRSKIFKMTYDDVNHSYSSPTVLVELDHNNRLISALGDKPFNIGGTDYLAVCTTRYMVDTGGLTEYPEVTPGYEGYVVLYPLDPTTGDVTNTTSTIVANHNYRCGGVSNLDGNMVISGRLVNQTITKGELEDIVSTTVSPKTLALDETVGVDSGGNTKYADSFFVDPSVYANSGLNQEGKGQRVSWLSGVSGIKLDDGKYNMVATNNFRVEQSGYLFDYQDAGIYQLTTGGMKEKVFSSIQTNFSNLNESTVSSSLILSEENDVPAAFPPGKFYSHPMETDQPRGATALPSLDPAMSEEGWAKLYEEMMNPQSSMDKSAIPPIDNTWVPMNCVNTNPPSC